MRLFAYYVVHTFVNTIKKLLRTWVAFFLLFIVLGAVGGMVVSMVTESLQSQTEQGDDVEEPDVPVVDDGDDVSNEENTSFFDFSFLKGLEQNTVIELAISALLLLMLVLTLFNNKGLETVFQPADVPILFSAPMKPQSVMMFRIATTLGMQIVFSLIMAFQLPNLILNAGLPVFGAISLIIGWMLFVLVVTLLQVLLYCISSMNDNLKKNMRLYIGIFFGVIAAIYIAVVVQNDNDLVKAAVAMFTGPAGYWVPFYGWIRGFCMNAIAGNTLWCIIFLALTLVAFAGMVALIWNMKVDFYEDAMIAAERQAKKLAKANAGRGTVVERDKARSEKLNRDGFRYGKGANVFFFKTLYNRFRLSWFKFLTKTMLLYLGVAVFVVILAKMKDFPFGFLAVCLAMCAVAFFRTLGNPLHEDVEKEFFLMIPASAREKLFWSLLGGIANTALDVIIPYLVAVVCLQPSVPEGILWFFFILAMDAYATVTNTFVHLSVGVKLPKTMQTMLQVMFIYFGIAPALIFIVLGIVLGNFAVFLAVGLGANLLMSFLLFMLTPLFLQNGRK